ncbi:hypothetical protein E2C01_096711 [Portunus trituberculatus]|uniref:Uncharacterized protein n=1 Tax=Portunus trituberculatus TaxID=210409 RepID=A0A5B7JYL7_PORTR|nr:hypothetical protein [Portunus trituberculatus]
MIFLQSVPQDIATRVPMYLSLLFSPHHCLHCRLCTPYPPFPAAQTNLPSSHSFPNSRRSPPALESSPPLPRLASTHEPVQRNIVQLHSRAASRQQTAVRRTCLASTSPGSDSFFRFT